MIPYGKQDISDADIEAVVNILRSDYLTQGPVVPAFESAVANYCKAQFAVAVNSATSALHIACLSLGVGKGDIVWTSPITFVASANCALYCDATIDFVDIDPQTYNMSVKALTEKLAQAEKLGKLPKVVIPVHLCGQSCEMEEIHTLSKKYGFKIIEDASHAIGGKYLHEPIGNCRYSDITVFSFHPVKIITTGEGGMALTNDGELAHKMQLLRSHGITRDTYRMTHASDGPWYYQQIELGFNYRMTDIQAALGLSQFKRLDEFVSKRHRIANQYREHLSNCALVLPWQHSDTYSSYHLFVIRLLDQSGISRQQVFHTLREAHIGANVHYIPVHTQPYYQNLGFKSGDFQESEGYYQTALSLPIFPNLPTNEIKYITDTLSQAIK